MGSGGLVRNPPPLGYRTYAARKPATLAHSFATGAGRPPLWQTALLLWGLGGMPCNPPSDHYNTLSTGNALSGKAQGRRFPLGPDTIPRDVAPVCCACSSDIAWVPDCSFHQDHPVCTFDLKSDPTISAHAGARSRQADAAIILSRGQVFPGHGKRG